MRKLGAFITCDFANNMSEGMKSAKKAGFDSMFTDWKPNGQIKEWALEADKVGLCYETIHAPFYKINNMWHEGVAGDEEEKILCDTVCDAADNRVPCIIVHTMADNTLFPANVTGIRRFANVAELALKKGVKLAFENLEFIEPVGLVFDKIPLENIGFCYDVGHANCYTPGLRLLKMYGEKLLCLHIHDNEGIAKSFDVNYRDDLHRIPFDGSVDFAAFAKDLRETGFDGTLMLEVGNRKDYDFYKDYTLDAFYERAFAAAVRLRSLVDG